MNGARRSASVGGRRGAPLQPPPGVGRRNRPRSEPRIGHRLSAGVYDRVYAWKDYSREARKVHELVGRYGPPRASTLLDVACGTGEHLRFLSRWYRTTGLDASPAMLRLARPKLPGSRWVLGRMQSFRLRTRFDAITCLFSAIGYVDSQVDLRRAVRNMARHLRPGGVLLVEPWLSPAIYRAGTCHLGIYGSKEYPIVRPHLSERRGNRSIMDMHYLVGTADGVWHWVERHDMELMDDRAIRGAFRAAGLRVYRVPSGFSTKRGLYVGVNPAPPHSRSRKVGPRRPVTRPRPRRSTTRAP